MCVRPLAGAIVILKTLSVVRRGIILRCARCLSPTRLPSGNVSVHSLVAPGLDPGVHDLVERWITGDKKMGSRKMFAIQKITPIVYPHTAVKYWVFTVFMGVFLGPLRRKSVELCDCCRRYRTHP